MSLIIFSSFIIICFAFSIKLHSAKKKEAEIDREFWAREYKANFTRKKPLDNLDFITIPDYILNMEPATPNGEIKSCLCDLKDLSAEKIVNLTGYTNTDLKLEYGTANITILSDYDFHYTNMVTILQKLAELLHADSEDELAMEVLEFAVATKTDVSKTYYLLAELYVAAGTPEKIELLITMAENIHSLMKDTIVQKLRAVCQ